MLVIGLTGGIGCGKSAAAEIFAQLGVAVIDTDQISRRLTEAGQPALAAIREQFGGDYFLPDGNLDRARLRHRVFSDPEAKSKLERILHPLIKEEVRRLLAEVLAPYAIVAVPLLLETGNYGDLVQRILVVDCTESQQVERVVARSKLSADEVRAIMAAQIGRSERLRMADDICNNDGDLHGLRRQIVELHQKYLGLRS